MLWSRENVWITGSVMGTVTSTYRTLDPPSSLQRGAVTPMCRELHLPLPTEQSQKVASSLWDSTSSQRRWCFDFFLKYQQELTRQGWPDRDIEAEKHMARSRRKETVHAVWVIWRETRDRQNGCFQRYGQLKEPGWGEWRPDTARHAGASRRRCGGTREGVYT